VTDQKAVLQARLDRNYQDYVAGLQSKTADELIELAPEITVAQHLRKELADYCKENDITFLLHFDDPLELVRGYWLGEILGYDHSSEINYMLRSARKDIGDDIERQDKTAIAADGIAPPLSQAGRDSVRHHTARKERGER